MILARTLIAASLAAVAHRTPGPNERALKAWISLHMPELSAELQGMRRADVVVRLNALTSANVRSCDTIEDGSARFLAALQDLTGEP